MFNRRTLMAMAALVAAVFATPVHAQDKSIVRVVDNIDAGFGPVRLHPAAVQAEDRHRSESRRARNRPGARYGPARRRRRRICARQIGGRKIPRRRRRREALPGDVQRLRADRAQERSCRHQGHEGRGRGPSRQIMAKGAPSSRAATNQAPTSPNSTSGRRPVSTSRRTRDPGTNRSARAWAPH